MSPTPLLLAFYGDDFTGSTDAMEALALAGVRTALFLEPPRPERLARYAGLQAIGVAGISRSLPVGRMAAELEPAFEALRQLGPRVLHYKVCSTFDSSPEIGSIGRAIDLGRRGGAGDFVPLVIGAPRLERYCAFGNLFARSGLDSPVYRLDRHPTMSRHPVTPMTESDLRQILASQTACRVGLVDLTELCDVEQARAALTNQIRAGANVVLFDTTDETHLAVIGELIWEQSTSKAMAGGPLFGVGSSGLEQALATYWRRDGIVPPPVPLQPAPPVEQILVVSGSCSPVTARQIETAVAAGFREIGLRPEEWASEGNHAALAERIIEAAQGGASVVAHVAKGPDDPRIAAGRAFLAGRSAGAELGRAFGRALLTAIRRTDIRRVAVTGGDTSGYIARELGIESLSLRAPLDPGSPLCSATATEHGSVSDGLEIALKGGQVGRPEYLLRVRRGTA